MFNSPYPFCSLGKSELSGKDPHRKIFYKFYAKHRTYLVTLEFFSFGLIAIKYCDVKDKNSGKAYHKLFNDGDAFRVVGTCFYIMQQYLQKHKDASFVFYASLREISEELLITKKLNISEMPKFVKSYRRSRYSIYRYGMVNLFSYEYFKPISDKENCVYVLLNRKQQNENDVIERLKSFLLKHHDILFAPE